MTAEALCQAIMRHSEVASNSDVQVPEMAEQELQIAELTASYRNMTNERTGVDIDFRQEIPPGVGPLNGHHDDFSGNDENALKRQMPTSPNDEVFLVDKWYIQINLPTAFIEFARQRVRLEINSLEEAVRLLCERDDWKPQGYPDGLLTVLQHDVQLCLE
jgi:hypothetical protein